MCERKEDDTGSWSNRTFIAICLLTSYQAHAFHTETARWATGGLGRICSPIRDSRLISLFTPHFQILPQAVLFLKQTLTRPSSLCAWVPRLVRVPGFRGALRWPLWSLKEAAEPTGRSEEAPTVGRDFFIIMKPVINLAIWWDLFITIIIYIMS